MSTTKWKNRMLEMMKIFKNRLGRKKKKKAYEKKVLIKKILSRELSDSAIIKRLGDVR
jgi:hypothetical protein